MLIQLKTDLRYFLRTTPGGSTLRVASKLIRSNTPITLNGTKVMALNGKALEFKPFINWEDEEFFLLRRDLTPSVIKVLDNDSRDHEGCICQPLSNEIGYQNMRVKTTNKK